MHCPDAISSAVILNNGKKICWYISQKVWLEITWRFQQRHGLQQLDIWAKNIRNKW